MVRHRAGLVQQLASPPEHHFWRDFCHAAHILAFGFVAWAAWDVRGELVVHGAGIGPPRPLGPGDDEAGRVECHSHVLWRGSVADVQGGKADACR